MNKSVTTMNNNSLLGEIAGWFFGVLFCAIGLLNTCWGNDPGYGIFVILLSGAFFPPANRLLQKRSGFTLPPVAKIVLALFILWSALGVGELFDKIDLMLQSF